MKCAKLRLQDRTKTKTNKENDDEPRRFCQKRMVNPEHEEDPRWTDAHERYYCNDFENFDLNETNESGGAQQCRDDLFLTVQNLQFQGNVEQSRRPRTSFKYKTLPNNQKHRMFVKQVVEESTQNVSGCYSVLSNYGDDYMKYISNNDKSRPSSSNSSIVLYCLNNKNKENKSIQVDLRSTDRRKTKFEKGKKLKKIDVKTNVSDDLKRFKDDISADDTTITFHKSGKRKSLTISRTESPATVQIIRVDVVCNYSSSSTISDYDDNRKESIINNKDDLKDSQMKYKKSHFTNNYMLMNSVKKLDENVSGGKVTLMCKTFKLTDRSKHNLDRKLTRDTDGKVIKNTIQK